GRRPTATGRPTWPTATCRPPRTGPWCTAFRAARRNSNPAILGRRRPPSLRWGWPTTDRREHARRGGRAFSPQLPLHPPGRSGNLTRQPRSPDHGRPMSATTPTIRTIKDLLQWTTDYFHKKGFESPRLEAQILLAHVMAVPKIELVARSEEEPTADEKARFK